MSGDNLDFSEERDGYDDLKKALLGNVGKLFLVEYQYPEEAYVINRSMHGIVTTCLGILTSDEPEIAFNGYENVARVFVNNHVERKYFPYGKEFTKREKHSNIEILTNEFGKVSEVFKIKRNPIDIGADYLTEIYEDNEYQDDGDGCGNYVLFRIGDGVNEYLNKNYNHDKTVKIMFNLLNKGQSI